MTQEELQELIDTKIQKGMTYQQVYDELNAALPGREVDIAALIAELPSTRQRAHYASSRWAMSWLVGTMMAMQLYCIVWGLLLTSGLYAMYAFVWFAGNVYWMWQMWRWRSTAFKLAGYWSIGMVVLCSIIVSIEGNVYAFSLPPCLAAIALGLWLESKLGGKYIKHFLGHRDGPDGRMAVYEIKFQNE